MKKKKKKKNSSPPTHRRPPTQIPLQTLPYLLTTQIHKIKSIPLTNQESKPKIE
jgi:hypothetical protein